jgi:hypothetical protein
MQTPEEYVATHEISLLLKRLGLTEKQLDQIQFRPNNAERALPEWTFTWGPGTPLDAIPDMMAYCALKFLVLGRPKSSKDKEDASHLVSVATAAPIYRIGIKHKEAQRLRAKKPRGKRADDGRTIHSIIDKLALHPEHRDETAKELWGHLFSELDSAGLCPKEIVHSDQKKVIYSFEPPDGQASITRGRFDNLVSKYRKKSR